ncbi:MAG: radical SAM protein [Hormoscilla sp. GM7CHS1pb]|nr:radical SAM protein [Hormoscilla sp. GM7CHS1pb]
MIQRNQEQQLPNITDVMLEPLQTSRVIDGHQAIKVGDEVMFSNDSLISPLQPYPGAWLPNLDSRTKFPVPDRVGEYCSRSEFEKLPKFMAQWVHWPKRAQMVLEARYHELPPVHFEGIFTLVCNFMCPHCSRRETRTHWVEGGSWDNNTPIEKRNTMHPEGLRRVIDQMATKRIDDQMGIVWGGGDPTASPFTYDAMLYARSLGITASFLTNGVFLDVDRVLDADPILVRVSLNCGTEEAYRKFHGYPKGWDYFERVKLKMRELARRKQERKARTLVGISLIIDERNMDDFVAAVEEIRALVNEVGAGIDYVIARPVFNYDHFEHKYAKLKDDTKKRAYDLVKEEGICQKILDEVGIPLILIKDSFEEPPSDNFYKGTNCLAYGMCGEIRHNGDVQLCSDSYGNPEYTIGNLFEQTLEEIWSSQRRKEVLAKINAKECYKTACPHNSRGHHYNRLFHQIEESVVRDKWSLFVSGLTIFAK